MLGYFKKFTLSHYKIYEFKTKIKFITHNLYILVDIIILLFEKMKFKNVN